VTRLAFLTLAALATFALRRIAVVCEAMRWERARGERPREAMLGLDPSRVADGRIHVGDRDARHITINTGDPGVSEAINRAMFRMGGAV
jgi:hypothetical protein